MKKLFLFCLLMIAPVYAFGAGWTPDLTVGSIFTEGTTDLIIIYTEDGAQYASGCQINAWSFAADTDARRGRVYSTVMTALASGKKIRFWYQDTCGDWSYHQATSVMLVK